MRFETKRRIWILSLGGWKWIPRWIYQPAVSWWFGWMCFGIEWIDKQWLDDCERAGCSLLDTFEWVMREAMENQSVDKEQ